MKKTITLFSLLFTTAFVSKAQITITASDVPMPATENLMEYVSAAQPSSGANQNWDVSTNAQLGPTSLVYQPETVPYWLGIGADVYKISSKNLTSSLVYNIFQEFDKATNGFNEIGFNVPAQSYGISSFTGNTADSLILPEQDITYSTAKTLLPFPCTSNSSFSNSGRRVVNFTINAPALGLNNTPFTHVLNEVRHDSIIGWGKMRVYTPSGASQPYDVLMDRITNYSLDSFYMAGSPAPSALLTTFGVTQGQKVNTANAINFYRKGHFNYLYRLFYGADNSFTNFTAAFSHTKDVSVATGINKLNEQQFSTILFPNPSSHSNITLKLIGGNASDFTNFTITNYMGQIIKNEIAVWNNSELTLPTTSLAIGNYYLNIINKKSGQTISESFIVK